MSNKVIEEVIAERKRQDEKWGKDSNHHPLEWIAILGKQFGHINKGALEGHFSGNTGSDYSNYREEIIHVAAVAVAMAESFDKHGSPK